MKVNVKLYATLQQYAPKGTELGASFPVEFAGNSVAALIRHLEIKDEDARIVMVNGIRVTELDYTLNDEDLVVIFPPIGGG